MVKGAKNRKVRNRDAQGSFAPAFSPPGRGLPDTVRGGETTIVEQPMVAPAPKRGDKLTRGGQSSGRPGQIVTAANRWRENYNPLRALTIRRVVELLELGQRGDTAYLQWTYRNVERRYPTLSGLISRCEAPLLSFDWEIKIKERLPAGGETTKENPFKAMAERQKATLTEAYDNIDNFKAAIQHLHLAEFRGYAHLQKWRDESGDVYHLEPLHQWCVCRDGLEGNWFWNPDSRSTSQPLLFLGKDFCIGGDALPIEDFIIRECPRPIDEIGIVNTVRANLCEKDWDGFIEIYAIPGGVVVMPSNVPQGKEAEYETSAKQIAEGGSGALPAGASYTPNDGPRGVDPFTPRLRHLDEQLVLAGTGGKLTMLAESGSGTLAGGAHEDAFEEIAIGRAQKICEQFQRDFDAEVLARKHPAEPVLVYFQIVPAEAGAEASLQFVREMIRALLRNPQMGPVVIGQLNLKETLRASGVVINEQAADAQAEIEMIKKAALAPKESIQTTKDTEDTNGGEGNDEANGKLLNRGTPLGDPKLVKNGQALVVEALMSEFAALNGRLAAISEITDAETQKRKLAAILDDLDKFEADLAKDPAVAQAIYKVLAAGFANGLVDQSKDQSLKSKVQSSKSKV